MYKYKYFPIFIGGGFILLLLLFFPISYDNNDDQLMYFLSSGVLSDNPSAHLLLTNILIGKALRLFFHLTEKVNWYTLYLQSILLLSFLTICYSLVKKKNITLVTSGIIVSTVLFGFYALCIVKMQFTTVSLLCMFAGWLYFRESNTPESSVLYPLLLVAIAILVRKESYFVFMLFVPSYILLHLSDKFRIKQTILFIVAVSAFFFLFGWINNNDAVYKKENTYTYVKAIDAIVVKPVRLDDAQLVQQSFTKNDISLMKSSWFVADEAYSSGQHIFHLTDNIRSNRTLPEMIEALKGFMADQRYLLLLYGLSIIGIVLVSRRYLKEVFVYGITFLAFLLYLSASEHIPHRVIYPVLSFLIILHLSFIVEDGSMEQVRWQTGFLCVLLLLSVYKFYCTTQLYSIQKENHRVFVEREKEISSHPEYLFVALYDGLQTEYMNAWQTPLSLFDKKNIVLTGWYPCTPDYKVVLQQHQLTNLTSSLKGKKEVLFLTDLENFPPNYVQMMKERYGIKCHFEPITNGFKTLHPKRLVFDH